MPRPKRRRSATTSRFNFPIKARFRAKRIRRGPYRGMVRQARRNGRGQRLSVRLRQLGNTCYRLKKRFLEESKRYVTIIQTNYTVPVDGSGVIPLVPTTMSEGTTTHTRIGNTIYARNYRFKCTIRRNAATGGSANLNNNGYYQFTWVRWYNDLSQVALTNANQIYNTIITANAIPPKLQFRLTNPATNFKIMKVEYLPLYNDSAQGPMGYTIMRNIRLGFKCRYASGGTALTDGQVYLVIQVWNPGTKSADAFTVGATVAALDMHTKFFFDA